MGLEKRYVTITTSVSSDGLGVPTISIYFSYCDKKNKTGYFCPMCQNKELQDDGFGNEMSLSEIISVIENKIKKLFIMFDEIEIAFVGGEPLAEINRGYVYEIAKHFKKLGIKNIIYTWRTIEDLKIENIDISHFDRIVCGEYIDKLKDDSYILGSTNQYVINNKYEKIIRRKLC